MDWKLELSLQSSPELNLQCLRKFQDVLSLLRIDKVSLHSELLN